LAVFLKSLYYYSLLKKLNHCTVHYHYAEKCLVKLKFSTFGATHSTCTYTHDSKTFEVTEISKNHE